MNACDLLTLSFSLDDYRHHTSCITEKERYEKTIFRGTRKLDESGTGHRSNQGQKVTPQEMWNQTIEIAAENSPQSLQSYMIQLVNMDNVPKNEKKFRNFSSNSLRLTKSPSDEKIKGEIWALLVKAREDIKKKRDDGLASKVSKKQHQHPAKGKKEDPKESDSKPFSFPDNEVSFSKKTSATLPSEKKVTKTMRRVLKKSGKLKFKVLQKQVRKSLALNADKKEFKKLCEQVIESNPKKIVMDGKVVSLKK